MFNQSNLTNLSGTFTQHNSNISYGLAAGQGTPLLHFFNIVEPNVGLICISWI